MVLPGVYSQTAGTGPFLSTLRKVLIKHGIQLQEVNNFADALALDVLICPWTGLSASANGSLVENDDTLQRTHTMSAAALAQLRQMMNTNSTPAVVWVTFRAVGVASADDDRKNVPKFMDVAAAPLWGLARTARSEHLNLRLQLVDLDSTSSEADMRALLKALDLQDEPECAIRKGKLFVPRLQRVTQTRSAHSEQFRVRAGGAVLVTGAFGDIGKDFCRRLARAHQVTAWYWPVAVASTPQESRTSSTNCLSWGPRQ